ncbi:MAG: Bacterial SH3 domain protein [bacterium ADurb.Bin157]|nr:MAG: Bacterial SH3 domain protein [bacterium ADurb.Bin157]
MITKPFVTRFLCVFVFCGIFSSCLAQQVAIVTSNASLTIRSAPSRTSDKIGSVKSGEKVVVLEKTSAVEVIEDVESAWYKIQYSGQEGFVFGGFLSLIEKELPTNTVVNQPMTSIPPIPQKAVIRSEPIIYKVRPNAQQGKELRECLANQRVIAGAVLMYNMDDHIEKFRSLTDEDVMSASSVLILDRYLKVPPVKPSKHCHYMSSGDLSSDDDDNAVFCKYHGGFWEEKLVKFIVSDDLESSSDYISMDIDDLKLDIASLSGKKVKVAALGQYFGQMFLLKKDMMDMSPIFVEIKNIPREQMKYIIQNCNTGAEVIVSGIVGEVSFQQGIIAEKVEW